MVRMGSLISGIDYVAHGRRSLEALGLGGLTVEGMKAFLASGEMPGG
jgi:hypothetical protein